MSRFLYENSVSHQGYLIIPFVCTAVDSQSIYSYALLSEVGHQGKFHKLENPAGIYSGSIDDIIQVAKSHLDEYSDVVNSSDYFKQRYVYCNELIIIVQISGKYFYDHYKPESLHNVAAPKLFISEEECISWVKQGLDQSNRGKEVKQF